MPRRAHRSPASTEWVGGAVPMPTTITGEGEPYRPDMLLWLSPTDELILGVRIARPEELLGSVVDHLHETIAVPAAGPPGPPARLRVATEALAAVLRPAFPDIDVVVAETPEIELVGGRMAASLASSGGADPGWLGGGPDDRGLPRLVSATGEAPPQYVYVEE